MMLNVFSIVEMILEVLENDRTIETEIVVVDGTLDL